MPSSFFVEGCLQAFRLASGERFAVGGEGGEKGYQQGLFGLCVGEGFFELEGEGEFQECRLLLVFFAEHLDFGEGEGVFGISQLVDEDELCEGLSDEGFWAWVGLACAGVFRAGGDEERAKDAEDGDGVFHGL